MPSASARSGNSREIASASRAISIPSLRRPCIVLSMASILRDRLSKVLMPALHEATSPTAAVPIEGRSLRGGGRSASTRLSSAHSSA